MTPVGFAPLADVPLAPRTTLGVGGRARWLVEAKAEVEVIEALAWAGERSLSVLVLGGGSNLLVADRGFDGLVLCPRLRGVDARLEQASAVLDAGAGEPWDELVAHSVARGWAGVECLSGIPGDVGATPIQNVGAYGQEVSDTLTRVRAVERATGRAVDLDAAACGFGYRDSIFKREAKDRYVVTSVRFALRLGGAPTVRYGELSKELERRFGPREASLAEVRETVIALRRGKAMVLDPDGENGKSAGSFFMNPTVPAATAASVREKALAAGVLAADEAMPEFAGPGGLVKLSAGWLIERAGLRRGTSDGRVGLSTKHALAIVNKGGATAAEILAFARRVRGTVLDRFGVALVPEPVLIGFQPGELDGLV